MLSVISQNVLMIQVTKLQCKPIITTINTKCIFVIKIEWKIYLSSLTWNIGPQKKLGLFKSMYKPVWSALLQHDEKLIKGT